jgi:GR25 family glycosyltransferase involved in LPS biosynthesis
MGDTNFHAKFDSFVINLKRESAKLSAFMELNRATGISIAPFKAVDGLKISPATKADTLHPTSVNYSPGAIGNALSHRTLWTQCAGQQKNFLIFEDDAVIRHDAAKRLLANMPDQWDIILLGYNTDSTLDLKLIGDLDFAGAFTMPYPTRKLLTEFSKSTDPIAPIRLNVALGVCAYAVSPAGARNLVKTCFPMDNRLVPLRVENRSFPAFGIDCMMAASYRQLQAYACVPPLAMTPNDRATSTVQTRQTV